MRSAILPIGLWISSTAAFVTLDTSVPRLPMEAMNRDSGSAADSIPALAIRKAVETVGSVLFLSGEDQSIYAIIGLLKAMQDSGLAPDLVVAEGAAAIPAAAYALGYKMAWLDSLFKVHSFESYLGGESAMRRADPTGRPYASPKQDGTEPLPWQKSLATGHVEWNDWNKESKNPHPSGQLALSWLMARLLRGAPSESARIPIAFQRVEEKTGNVNLARPGDWQGLVLAAARVVSQGRPLAGNWPVEVGNMVVMEVPFSLGTKPQTGEKYPVSSLKLIPAGNLDSTSAWVEMGYQAVLRSIPALRSVFHARAQIPENPSRSGNESLLWSNASFNARGAGYFQLLRQRVRAFSRLGEPELWIPALGAGGFYSDIDVEWAGRDGADGEGGLVLGAQEDPRILISAGASLRVMGESMLRQIPEGLVSLSWAEPHYLPFKAEGAWLAGGNHPGFGGQFLVEPPAPFWARLSAYGSRQSHRFEVPFSNWRKAGAIPISMREDKSGFRMGIGPIPNVKWVGEIRRTVLDNLAESPDPAAMDDGFASTDFLLTLQLKFGENPGPQIRRLDITSSYVDPDNESGLVRQGFSLYRGELEAVYGPWEVFGQGQYADHVDLQWEDPSDPDWLDAYALWLMPPLRPLSFGNGVMATRWRHFRHALAGGGLHYSWQRLAGRLVGGGAGYMRWNGNSGQESRSYFPFWEGGVSLATGLGPFRFACGGVGDSGPFFSLQWGTRLNLDRMLSESEL